MYAHKTEQAGSLVFEKSSLLRDDETQKEVGQKLLSKSQPEHSKYMVSFFVQVKAWMSPLQLSHP